MAHIQKRNGRYQARYRDPGGKERTATYDRKVDAEFFLNTTGAAMARGTWVDPRLGRITFGEWATHLEQTRTNRRATTRSRDEASLRNHLLPHFGDMPISAIQPLDVRNWISLMECKDLAPATIHKAFQLLSRPFSVAIAEGRIGQTPCRAIVLPKDTPTPRRYLTAEEVNDLAASIDPRFRALVLTAAYTGLRIGELSALRVANLDTLRGTLRVEETLTEVSGELSFGPPKTNASRRTVSMPGFLVKEVVRHLKGFPDRSQLVFASPEGGPIRRTNFRRRFWLPAVDSSVGRPCTFHSLRHTHAALLIGEGAHPKVIQERLGHGSIRVTLDTYGHLVEGLDQAAADALDGAFKRSLDSTPTTVTVADFRTGSSA